MRLTTIQSKDILDIIKEKGVYKADYELVGYDEYKEQYKRLADFCGFSNCPIFCAPHNDDTSLYGIVEDENHIRIELNIPKTRAQEMGYYDWSSYLCFSSGIEAYDEDLGFTPEEALENIDSYVVLGKSDISQFCIQEIYLKDIVNKEILGGKNGEKVI